MKEKYTYPHCGGTNRPDDEDDYKYEIGRSICDVQGKDQIYGNIMAALMIGITLLLLIIIF